MSAVVEAKHVLAAPIIQALIQRGDFAKGAFDKLFPQGITFGLTPEWDKDAMAGIIAIVVLSLSAAEAGMAVNDKPPRPNGYACRCGEVCETVTDLVTHATLQHPEE